MTKSIAANALVVCVLAGAAIGGCKSCSKASSPVASSGASSASVAPSSSMPRDPLEGIVWNPAPIDWNRPLPVTPPGGVAQAGYVGSEACKKCHAAIYESYARHSMAKTGLRPLSSLDAKWLARIFDEGAEHPVRHEQSGYSYRPFRDGEKYFVEEFIDDESGKRVHSWTQPITHALSAGAYGMAFYFRQGERLFHVPIDYYAQIDRWDLDPGASRGNPRFSSVMETFCISCHSDYPRMRAETVDAFVDPLPSGVGCERCHGPGAAHVASSKPEDVVNPPRLSTARQIDVCAQCHESSNSMLRADRHDFSFRPGERLDAYRINWIEEPVAPDRFLLLGHPERMIQSACFRGSGGKLVCTSCHDPHESSFDQPASYWDQKCNACHHDRPCTEDPKVRAEKSDHCVVCHMRKGPPTRPTQVTLTDHWIQRKPPPIRPGESLPERLAPWAQRFGETDEGNDLRAIEVAAWVEAGRDDEAAKRVAAALEGWPHVPRLYRWIAEHCGPGASFDCGAVYAKVLNFQPNDAVALIGYARASFDRGAEDEALHALERMLALDPDSLGALETRGIHFFRTGKTNEARPSFEHAESQPFAVVSHVALGALARHDGRSADAIAELEAARKIEPRDGWIFEALAALYAKSGDEGHADALEHARAFFQAHGGLATTPATAWLPPSWK